MKIPPEDSDKLSLPEWTFAALVGFSIALAIFVVFINDILFFIITFFTNERNI